LREFSTPSTRLSAQYPFCRLQGDGLWEVEAPVALARRRSNTDPKVIELRRDGVRGGFPESADRTLRTDPEFVSRVARTVLDEHFPTSLHPDILTKVGLDVGVAERSAEPYAGRTRRDHGFAAAVLRAYEYRCAVCAYAGQVGKISVGIEAAHLKWFSHGGLDVVENGLSLCSLHHEAFDLGAIATSDDHKILVSRDFRGRRGMGGPLPSGQRALSWGRERASLRSVRSSRGTARRCTGGRSVCSGERSKSDGAGDRPTAGFLRDATECGVIL